MADQALAVGAILWNRPKCYRICSICGQGPAVVRVTITDPLVDIDTSFVCADCRPIAEVAVRTLQARAPRLVASFASLVSVV